MPAAVLGSTINCSFTGVDAQLPFHKRMPSSQLMSDLACIHLSLAIIPVPSGHGLQLIPLVKPNCKYTGRHHIPNWIAMGCFHLGLFSTDLRTPILPTGPRKPQSPGSQLSCAEALNAPVIFWILQWRSVCPAADNIVQSSRRSSRHCRTPRSNVK
jgi:hypothetical protein